MTITMRQWMDSQILNPNRDHLPVGGFQEQVAEFWIKAFCEEVERAAIRDCKKEHAKGQGPDVHPCDNHLGESFDVIKRGLLGD